MRKYEKIRIRKEKRQRKGKVEKRMKKKSIRKRMNTLGLQKKAINVNQ